MNTASLEREKGAKVHMSVNGWKIFLKLILEDEKKNNQRKKEKKTRQGKGAAAPCTGCSSADHDRRTRKA